jgi:arabinofuranosyltransferase
LVVVVPALAIVVLGWRRRWTSDDGFITLRVVEMVLAGHGPVFNVGERVEAGTSPAWVGVLAAARLLTGGAVDLEWLAVGTSLACVGAGVLLGTWGALALQRPRPGTLPLPMGVLVVVSVAAYWDFATAGLESGFVLGWIGASFAGLAALARADLGRTAAAGPPARRRVALVAVLVGVGPLIRPDLGVLTVAFLVALLVAAGPASWRRRLGLVAAAAALPAAYQVFRMGFFAALVPNPALTKEASTAWWDQGLEYLGDTVGTYALWLPVGVLAVAVLAPLAVAAGRRGQRAVLAVTVAPVVAGLVHAAYVTRVGGDFMHARLLLPSLFTLLLPAFAVRADRRRAAAGLVVGAWAVVAITSLRPEPGSTDGIADERRHYVTASGVAHPVTIADYARLPWAERGAGVRVLGRADRPVLTYEEPGSGVVVGQPARPRAVGVVAAFPNIGVFGVEAGEDVHVVDLLGLSDPVGARQRLVERTRPGHEKVLDLAWVVARFGDPAAPEVPGAPPAARVAAARRALACGALDDLIDAVEGPLTVGRFLRNVVAASRFHLLRVPADPVAAAEELCGPAR